MKKHFTHVIGAAAAATVLAAGATAGSGPAATASARAMPAQAGETARTGPPGHAATLSGRLYAVSALSPTNAWAVGLHSTQSLIVHWDGAAWTEALSESGGPYYLGVAARTASDVWAVGSTDWWAGQPFTEHYNGTAWRQVPVRSVTPGGVLYGVTTLSATSAWAAGTNGPGGSGYPTTPENKTLIEHWNGTKWAHVPTPTPTTGGGFHAVAAASPTDIWAVGWAGSDTGPVPRRVLIDHWNGTTWTRVYSPPGPRGSTTYLQSVTALSATNAWAVGATWLNNVSTPFILHWNGSTWTRVHSATTVSGARLESVAAISASDIWAVGASGTPSCSPRCQTFTEHWNGATWTRVPSPNPPSGEVSIYLGVAATSSHDAWAVGSADWASTLITHWNGTTWTASAASR